ncbi:MarR family transcriptional regulator [Streptomyces sp. MNU77]|uniref:MarR family winged helix-turn-helix transcriptional regulator n=1 Tax=Streptomyces sp. MNU77 TaxID=1573406 RepID=UPI000698F95D|nr:MarR family transcriptional regulator [Streptomyces sp. MNU77]OLO25822.1 MarR family transcriptional regulator [Streptomyces sp. MNU77]
MHSPTRPPDAFGPAAEPAAAPDDESPAAEVARALEELLSWGRKVTPAGPLTFAELSCLDALGHAGPLRVSDLVARERMSQPGMTALVGRLVAAGYAARAGDERDRRVQWISLTGAGARLLQEVHAGRAAALTERIGRLPLAQRQKLAGSVEALRALAAQPLTSPPRSRPGDTTGEGGA